MKVQDLILLSRATGKSKKIKRTGWIREKIKNPESVADHIFRVTVLCMVLAKHFNLDQAKLTKMAIIHDLGESITEDLVVERGINVDVEVREKKEKLEEKAINKILGVYDPEYTLLFHEMIKRDSPEAKFFWKIDKLEMAIQAKEYEKEQGLDGKEFYENAKMHIDEPLLLEFLDEILKG